MKQKNKLQAKSGVKSISINNPRVCKVAGLYETEGGKCGVEAVDATGFPTDGGGGCV